MKVDTTTDIVDDKITTVAKKATVKKSPAKKTTTKAYELVIVESPAKAKTISKILGSKYRVIASQGHVRDLPKSRLGVEIENNFEPEYINIRGKAPLLNTIKKEAKNAKQVFLATDPDREGEAISWHIGNIIADDTAKRIEFNEITTNAIQTAIKTPREININKVNAQQARRVLDRLVGYKISPLLWEKVKKGLSAGRVQSVTMRMICDLEKEIENFVPEEFWTIEAKLLPPTSKKTFIAKYYGDKNGKVKIETKEQTDEILKDILEKPFVVSEVKKGNTKKHAPAPFSTSTLQQDASRKLNFTTKKTMMVAQQLYEGVDIKKKGHVGLVSYIRTDSVRISSEAQIAALEHIEQTFGKEYVPDKPNVYKGRKGAQDAHEAIRPTYLNMNPEQIKESLTKDQYKLYKLVYDRFLASQMSEAKYETLSVTLDVSNHIFKSSGQRMLFAGFTAAYQAGDKEDKIKDDNMPNLNKDDVCKLKEEILGEQHFTQPPARFNEASLVRALEEKGIGRPSTYAPTISTIFDRGYVTRKEKTIMPTELGKIVSGIMVDNFEKIVDLKFTADMEDRLDEIEDGNIKWKELIKEFYDDFAIELAKAEVAIEKIQLKDEESDVPCEKCGSMMVYKIGKFGKFLACPNFPDCRNTKAIVEHIDASCPKCGGQVRKLKSRKGKPFYGCEKYPECDFVSWDIPTNEKCTVCGSFMVKKTVRGTDTIICSNQECETKAKKPKKAKK